jgi:hypothetical protein
MAGESPFGDFEDDFKSTEKAPPGSTPGRVPPSTYKFVLTTNDPKGDGQLIDHDVIVGSNTGTKGFKIFCEILDPASVPNPKTGEPHVTKGEVLEHVWWVTKKTLPFIMRDVSTILGRDLKSMSELTSLTWAGRTFEGVVGDEEYQGIMRSRIKYINAWAPEKAGDKKTSDAKAETKKAAAPPPGPGKQAVGASSKPAPGSTGGKPDVDF